MSANANRKQASMRLAVEMRKRYGEMLVTSNQEELTAASAALSVLFLENIEFIIYSLLKTGGNHNPPLPEKR